MWSDLGKWTGIVALAGVLVCSAVDDPRWVGACMGILAIVGHALGQVAQAINQIPEIVINVKVIGRKDSEGGK